MPPTPSVKTWYFTVHPSAISRSANCRLVLGLCDHIVVLDSGAVIETGPPAAIRASEKVRHAYMGTAANTDLPVLEVEA